jgi:hypothetical protein
MHTSSPIPFQTIDWNSVPAVEHPGEKGMAIWQTVQLPDVRIRIVRYSPGYLADHWCRKGHIVHCLDGEFISELESGQQTKMVTGMTYVVTDDESTHRSRTRNGAILLIIDGDFLKQPERE